MRRALAAILLVAPALAHADRRVTGTVLDDATNQPIVGALVAIGTGEVATDATGGFTLGDAPFGRPRRAR